MYHKPHRKRGRYFNNVGESLVSRIKELFKTAYKLFKHNVKNPEKHHKHTANQAWHGRLDVKERSHELRITWLGHASFLIQMNNVNVLTDPVFYEISRLTPRYVDAIPDILTQLPPIDVVVISHNHPDHMDKRSLVGLRAKVKHWLVPNGDKAWFDKRGFIGAEEKHWWEPFGLHRTTITFLPANHWSGRYGLDMNKSLWGSWILQAPGLPTVYFAGDTAYSKHFEVIGKQFDSIDFALMPIGPNEPETMRETHVSAAEAVQGFLDLGATHFIPMHFGTFKFGTDTFNSPLELLEAAWQGKEAELADKKILILKHGQSVQCEKKGSLLC